MTRTTKTFVLITLLISIVGLGLSESSRTDKSAAIFEGKALVRPEGYREWIFVGSSLGLAYSKNPGPGPDLYHNVYINPSSYREFAKTGNFPEGTVMVLELARPEVKSEPGLQGSFQKEFVALEASVKDSSRFEGGWAYFNFTEAAGKLKAKAEAFPQSACWSCHHVNAATDHVFTQFYPVLRAVAPK
jgi:cytochrome P460